MSWEVTDENILRNNCGVRITIKYGEISKIKADVIVNSTSKELQLNSGAISDSILKDAGPSIQRECNEKYPHGIQFGEVVRTKAGNLSCKKIYHGSCCQWQDEHEKPKEIFQRLINNILALASKQKMTTIAIPAIGTGNLGFPQSYVANKMIEHVKDFMDANEKSSIEEIILVIYQNDISVQKAFEEEMCRLNPSTYRLSKQKDNSPPCVKSKPIVKRFTKVVIELQPEHCKPKLQETDAVVQIKHMSLFDPILARLKGDTFEVAVTKAGDGSKSTMLHFMPPTTSDGMFSPEWEVRIRRCLIEADRRRLKSITFPDFAEVPSRNDIAKVMMKTFTSFVDQAQSLQSLRVTLLKPELMHTYQIALDIACKSKDVAVEIDAMCLNPIQIVPTIVSGAPGERLLSNIFCCCDHANFREVKHFFDETMKNLDEVMKITIQNNGAKVTLDKDQVEVIALIGQQYKLNMSIDINPENQVLQKLRVTGSARAIIDALGEIHSNFTASVIKASATCNQTKKALPIGKATHKHCKKERSTYKSVTTSTPSAAPTSSSCQYELDYQTFLAPTTLQYYQQCSYHQTSTKTQLRIHVGRSGGVFHVHNVGISLVVHPHSFDEDVMELVFDMITQNQCDDQCTIVTMNPHGKVFKKPLLLKYRLKCCELGNLALQYRPCSSYPWRAVEFKKENNATTGHTKACTLAPKWVACDGYAYVFVRHFSDHKICKETSSSTDRLVNLSVFTTSLRDEDHTRMKLYTEIILHCPFRKVDKSPRLSNLSGDITQLSKPIDLCFNDDAQLIVSYYSTEEDMHPQTKENILKHILRNLCDLEPIPYHPRSILMRSSVDVEITVTQNDTNKSVVNIPFEYWGVRGYQNQIPSDGVPNPPPTLPQVPPEPTLPNDQKYLISINALISGALHREMIHHLTQRKIDIREICSRVGLRVHNGDILSPKEVLSMMFCDNLTNKKMEQWEKFLQCFYCQPVPDWVKESEEFLSIAYACDDSQLLKISRGLGKSGMAVGIDLGVAPEEWEVIEQDYPRNTSTCHLKMLLTARTKFFASRPYTTQNLHEFLEYLKDGLKSNNLHHLALECNRYNFKLHLGTSVASSSYSAIEDEPLVVSFPSSSQSSTSESAILNPNPTYLDLLQLDQLSPDADEVFDDSIE